MTLRVNFVDAFAGSGMIKIEFLRTKEHAWLRPPRCLLAGGPFVAGGVDYVTILVFAPDEKAFKRRGSAVVNHGLNLPDHATFANAGVRERSTAVACVKEEVVFAMA